MMRARNGLAIAAAVLPAGAGYAALRLALPAERAALTLALCALGLAAGRLAGRLVEQLIAFEPPYDDADPGEPLPWRMRLPFIGPYLGGPYDPPLRWFEYIPFFALFAAAFADARFGRLVPRPGPAGGRAIELACAALFAAFAALQPPGLVLAGSLFLALALVISSAIDARLQIIPDEVSCAAIAGAFALAPLTPIGFLPALQGALVGAGALYLLGELGRLVSGQDAMGGGDVKLIAAIGAFLGVEGTLYTIVGATFLAAPVGLFLRATGRAQVENGMTKLAFGPFLSIAALAIRLTAS